ncbi:hypothetical protein ACA910_003421 [Epithemia clementina (nom. ined.)]
MVLQWAKDEWKLPDHEIRTLSEFWEQWETNLNNLAPQVQACSGANALVAALAQRHIPMAIATSSRRAGVDKKRQNHESTLFQHFQVIVAGDDPAVVHGKPATDIYRIAAQRLGLDPRDCLVLEDAAAGCQAGQAAGCQVVAIPDARFTPEQTKELYGPYTNVLLDILDNVDGRPFGINVVLKDASSRNSTVQS